MINNTDELIRMKRENFTIQIRKQRREDIFKEKRVVPTSTSSSPEADLQYIQDLSRNTEKLTLVIQTSMDDIKRLYDNLPTSSTEILSNFKRLRRIQTQESNYTNEMFMRQDFIRVIAIFLNEQFSFMVDLQIECGFLLANFMGSVQRDDVQTYNEYASLIRLISKDFLRNFKKLVTSNNEKIVEMALYCFGNLTQDNFEVFMDFIFEDGFEILIGLALREIHSDLIVWILCQNFIGDNNLLSLERNLQLIPLLDIQLKRQGESLQPVLTIIQWMSSKETFGEPLIQMKNFMLIQRLMTSPKKDINLLATEIVSNLCWLEQIQVQTLNTDIYDVLDLKLSSFGHAQKIHTLWAIENLVLGGDMILAKLFSQNSLIDKIIACGYQTETKIVLAVCYCLTAITEQDTNKIYIDKLVDKSLIQLISHLLNHQREIILQNIFPLIGALGDLNERQCIGSEHKQGPIFQMMKAKSIFDKLIQIGVGTSSKTQEMAEQLCEYFSTFDE